jgi:hypothetical protein
MARHQSPQQQATIHRVMHEFKHHELPSSRGGKVKNPKQAIAIALSEAGASNQQSSAQNRKQLRRSKQKEHSGRTAQAEKEGRKAAGRTLSATKRSTRKQSASSRRHSGEKTKAQLYRDAARQGVRGRSRMNKAELQRALHH